MKKSFGRFKCPECGSKMFGTSGCGDMETATGHCHGISSEGVYCRFSWSRKNDDINVFVTEDSTNEK